MYLLPFLLLCFLLFLFHIFDKLTLRQTLCLLVFLANRTVSDFDAHMYILQRYKESTEKHFPSAIDECKNNLDSAHTSF